MESKAKLFGHPIHPMLIVFPLGLLVMSVIFDVIYLKTKDDEKSKVARNMIGAGILGGLVAAPFGWIDWFAIPDGTRAKKIGLLHGLGNVLVLVLFALSWLRRGDGSARPDTGALASSFLGLGLGGVTSWMGGELVDRLGVGVDEGAHLDSPNALSGRPASENA